MKSKEDRKNETLNLFCNKIISKRDSKKIKGGTGSGIIIGDGSAFLHKAAAGSGIIIGDGSLV